VHDEKAPYPEENIWPFSSLSFYEAVTLTNDPTKVKIAERQVTIHLKNREARRWLHS